LILKETTIAANEVLCKNIDQCITMKGIYFSIKMRKKKAEKRDQGEKDKIRESS
jgi:hypothetical protein